MGKSKYARHVQKLGAGDNRRYIVATWNEIAGQWQAPMNQEAKDATGCHTLFARRLEDINPADCYTYVRRRDALRRAERLATPDQVIPGPRRSESPGMPGGAGTA